MDSFTIKVPDDDIADLKRRLAATRFPQTVRDAGWDYGTEDDFLRWSDHAGNLEEVYSLDVLCTILSVYWFSQSIGSSVRLYKEVMADQEILQPLHGHEVPQGVLVPTESDLPAPREWGERHLDNLIHWSEPKKGGHFPALEIPDIFAADIRRFAKAAASFKKA